MGRQGPILLVTLGLVLASAQPAFAIRGLFEWLDRLSGPGPMTGAGVEVVVYCRSGGTPSGGESSADVDRGTWFEQDCYVLPSEKRVVIVNFAGGLLRTGDNPSDGGGVKALVFAPSVDVRLHRAVDIGAGFGFTRFTPTGSPELFDAFWKPFVQIARVNVRPLMLGCRDSRCGFLTISGRLEAFGGFDAHDFGPVPREIGAEVVPSVGIGIDLGVFLFRH